MTIQPPRQRVTQLHEHEHQRFTANGKPSAADGKTLATTRQMGAVRVAASFIIPAQIEVERDGEVDQQPHQQNLQQNRHETSPDMSLVDVIVLLAPSKVACNPTERYPWLSRDRKSPSLNSNH